jgi:hypothetical protein
MKANKTDQRTNTVKYICSILILLTAFVAIPSMIMCTSSAVDQVISRGTSRDAIYGPDEIKKVWGDKPQTDKQMPGSVTPVIKRE